MHERTKDVDALRRLADLLRQAMDAATGPISADVKKQSPGIKRLKRADGGAPAAPPKDSGRPTEPTGRRWGN